MDKRKLIQIIEKELEELKVLSNEIAENEDDTSLIIELTLSKARLLCQELELLRKLSAKSASVQTEGSPEKGTEEQLDEEEYEISDPELEIVNFEEKELDETPETDEDYDDEFGEAENDTDHYDEDEDQDEVYVEEETEKEVLIEFEENDNIIDKEIEKTRSTVEQTELKMEAQPGIREITIDETDDENFEPAKIPSASNVAERPVMREIPKPEELIQEKPVAEEPLPKERSLNDTMGETKPIESQINAGSIPSLRAAIGLNDRFLFIREIFGNNTDKYNTIIDQLDKLETQQQAVELLKANITLQKNETSMKFVNLLKRRFNK